MEFDVVVFAKPLCYKRYADNADVSREKSIRDILFEDHNS